MLLILKARSYAVKLIVKVLSDDTFLLHVGEQGSCSKVLWAAAWICGGYCNELSAPDKLIQPEIVSLRPDITAMCIQSAMKLELNPVAFITQASVPNERR
ncbi:hypothetical protein EDD22DRAFT_939560 [Suillus occidentalis]|nr:hypothetical protein EDD22DRAFT_939560 [Suillus occidentalis]